MTDRYASLAHTYQIVVARGAAVHIILSTFGQRCLVRFDLLQLPGFDGAVVELAFAMLSILQNG